MLRLLSAPPEEDADTVLGSHSSKIEDYAGIPLDEGAEAHDVDLVVLGRCESWPVGRPASVSGTAASPPGSCAVWTPVLVCQRREG